MPRRHWLFTLLISCFVSVEAETVSESYLGCYRDPDSRLLMSGHVQESNRNSPEKCKSVCYRMGYLYAGLGAGRQCMCGDAHPAPDMLRDESQCSTGCPGDSAHTCGGNGLLSVYETGITDVPAQGRKLGCYDDEDPRALQDYKIELERTNSPRRCLNICRTLGYQYAGVEYGVECFCGNALKVNVSRDSNDEECSTQCPGDGFDTCGGNWELQPYRTGLSDPEPVVKKVGCYRTDGPPLFKGFRRDFPQRVTSAECARVCYNRGFLYAAIIDKTQCWCDQREPQEHLSVGNEACENNQATLYETGYIVSHPGDRDEYIGCFSHDKNSAFTAFSKRFDTQLTPEKCSQLCFNMAFRYSGTKNRNECHCSDEEGTVKVEDQGCSAVCSGDKSKRCGGSGKISLYSTGIPDVPTTGKLIGCFVDDTLPRALDGHKTDLERTNSPRRCLNYCLALGFAFAGVQYQKECFCGNTRPSAALDAPDSQCGSVCAGDKTEHCGGNWRLQAYRTGYSSEPVVPIQPTPMPTSTQKPDKVCDHSETLVNGKPACRGAVVFSDSFSGAAIGSHWQHIVKIADHPDYEFVTYTPDSRNSYQRDGSLVIRPTLLPDREVQTGFVKLENCTGVVGSRECELKAFSYNILPPIRSARLHTRHSFSFRYGIVEIRARLPAGDWLLPELWLLPKDQSYGLDYLSGKVRIAMSRGNRQLTQGGNDIGSSCLESGVLVGSEDNVTARSVLNRISDSWHSQPHNYTLVWQPDNLLFYVDGQAQQALLPPGARLTELMNLTGPTWSTGSRIAPFDTDFYLSLGLSVGGSRDFPDESLSKEVEKPWSNFKLKAMLNFWLAKDSWSPSWDGDLSSLLVESVRVTAL